MYVFEDNNGLITDEYGRSFRIARFYIQFCTIIDI